VTSRVGAPEGKRPAAKVGRSSPGTTHGLATVAVHEGVGPMNGSTLGNDLAGTLLGHIRAGRRRAAFDLVGRHLAPGSAQAGRRMIHALADVQREVGEAWQRAEMNVADEHVATAVVDDALGLVAAAMPDPAPDRSVAVVCAEGEWHVTPARMASLLFRAEGWHVTFLGGSAPPEHIHATLDLLRPDHVAVSCTTPLALPGAGRVAAAVHELGLRVVAGGRAFGTDDHRAHMLGIDGWAPQVAEAARMLEVWLTALPEPVEPPELDGEELTLELHEPTLVELALDRLGARHPEVAAYDARQRTRTREDLQYLLHFARVALLCNDPTIFTDMLPWLREVLGTRGVPVELLRAGLDVLAETADGLPRTQWLLSHPV
jgi:methanogenic corrinoid protein MtbC1